MILVVVDQWLTAFLQELQKPALAAQALQSLLTTIVAVIGALLILRRQLHHDRALVDRQLAEAGDLAAKQMTEARDVATKQMTEARELGAKQMTEARELAEKQMIETRELAADQAEAAIADRLASRRANVSYELGHALFTGVQAFDVLDAQQVAEWLQDGGRQPPGHAAMLVAIEHARPALGYQYEIRRVLIYRAALWGEIGPKLPKALAGLGNSVAVTAAYFGAHNVMMEIEMRVQWAAQALLNWDGRGEFELARHITEGTDERDFDIENKLQDGRDMAEKLHRERALYRNAD